MLVDVVTGVLCVVWGGGLIDTAASGFLGLTKRPRCIKGGMSQSAHSERPFSPSLLGEQSEISTCILDDGMISDDLIGIGEVIFEFEIPLWVPVAGRLDLNFRHDLRGRSLALHRFQQSSLGKSKIQGHDIVKSIACKDLLLVSGRDGML